MKPMSADEYALALERLGWSNRAFCLTVAGVEDRAGRRWKGDDAPVPGSVATLLRLAAKLDLSLEDLQNLPPIR